MRTCLSFKVIVIDRITLPKDIPAGSAFTVFSDNSSSSAESVTKNEEAKIVRWLFNLPEAKGLIFKELGIDQDSYLELRVSSPIIDNPNKKPGDIDVLICEQRRAEKAIAMECKRVKAIALNTEKDKVNKINDVGDGVSQANALHNFGFYETYLCVIVETDRRARCEYNVLFRSSIPKTFQQIYDFPLRDKLDEDVGVMFIEIVQPTGKDTSDMVWIGVCLDKRARKLEQSHHLTNRTKKVVGCVMTHPTN